MNISRVGLVRRGEPGGQKPSDLPGLPAPPGLDRPYYDLHSTRSRRRRPGRICRGVPGRRSRPAGRPDRSGRQPRRRVRLSRLHPIESAVARRQGDRRVPPRGGVGRGIRRADDRSRQAARVQEFGRWPADRRDRAARQASQGALPEGPGRDRRRAQPDGDACTTAANEPVRFDHAILATGSRPVRVPSLAIESDPRVWDSTRALDLPLVPKRLLVVGGGYIGLELGSVYATLGSQVTIVEMTAGLLPGADRDLVDVLAKRIGQIAKAVLLNTKVARMTAEPDGIRVTLEGADVKEPRTAVRQRAGRRRPAAQFGYSRPRSNRRAGGCPRLHRGRRAAPHPGAVDLRDRRRRRRADAGAQGVARRAHRGRSHRRRERGVRAAGDPGGGVHRSRDRLVRPDRDAGGEREAAGHGREVSMGGVRPRHLDRSDWTV